MREGVGVIPEETFAEISPLKKVVAKLESLAGSA
jgi:hypothetical protein